MTDLQGKRIAVTGLTGQVGRPVAEALARTNEVHGIARFSDGGARAELEAAGVHCHVVNLLEPDLGEIPRDVDFVLNFAVTKIGDWEKDLVANAEAVGHLMSHFRSATAFLHCSSTAVYAPAGAAPRAEDSALGRDHHAAVMPTYSTVKTAAEAVARFGAREFDLPTVITRLNVPYGDNGGWPLFHLVMVLADQPVVVHDDGARYNPIHHDDVIRQIPDLLASARVPATIVNWGGNDVVSIAEWSGYLAGLVGRQAVIEHAPDAIPSAVIDVRKQQNLVGRCEIPWQEGFRRMVAANYPDELV